MMEITHFSTPTYVYAVDRCTLNIRIQTNAAIEKIEIYYQNLYDHSQNLKRKTLSLLFEDGSHWFYEAKISIKERHFKYYFALTNDGKTSYFTSDGLLEEILPVNYFYYSAINDDEILNLPKWAEGEIIYQLLIDRFYDGDPSNNPENCRHPEELPDRSTYYGGDFQGIIKKLDYLKSLGVKIIYLSPLFLSPTYHKYDIKDYYQIEAIYGGEAGLKELVQKAHEKGLRIILDGIFNHCSSEHPFFQDLLRNGEKSPYRDWFYVYSYPVNPELLNYDSFACQVPSMPRFNTSNPEVIAYLTESAAYWTRTLDIDGWRLDVADEVAPSFWREFRRKVKAVQPEAIIIGEVWNQASRWLYGDQFDSVTNYKYRQHLLDFLLGKIDSNVFWKRVIRNLILYYTPTHNYLVNLVGSHDTIRLITALKNEKMHFLALAITLLINGMPLIYYGDEVGLEGDVDPDNRRAFPWHITKRELGMLQDIGNIRSASKVLKKGNLLPLYTKSRLLGFMRRYGEEEIIVYGNFSESEEEVSVDPDKIFYGEFAVVSGGILIPPYSIIIIKNK